MSFWTRFEQRFKKRAMVTLERRLDRGVVMPDVLGREAVRRVLVIRQHDQLGDFLLSTPVLRAVRESYPDAHIALVVRGYTAQLARNNRYVDEVMVFEDRVGDWTPARFLRLFGRLRSGWDLAIVLNTVSHSVTSDLLAYLSGARHILGSEHEVFPGCRRNFFYDLVAPYSDGRRHQSDRNLDIVRYVGIETADRSEIMTISEDEKTKARVLLRQQGIGEAETVAVLHPGATKTENRWPVERFAELAVALRRRFDLRLVVAWGPREDQLGHELLDRLPFPPVMLPGISLRDLAAVLSVSDVFVCNDTGVMHVAAAVETPLVAVFGPTDPDEWKPIGDSFIAVRGRGGRCEEVEVEEVTEAVVGLLKT